EGSRDWPAFRMIISIYEGTQLACTKRASSTLRKAKVRLAGDRERKADNAMALNEHPLTIAERRPAAKPAASATTQLSAEEAEIAQLPWMLRLPVACLLATAIGSIASAERLGAPAWLPWLCFAIAYATGGFYSIQEAWDTLKQRQFDVNFLMIIAAVGAAAVGQ